MLASGDLLVDAVDPELQATLLAMAVQEGGVETFENALRILHQTDDATERRQLLSALASVTDEALAARARALTLDPNLRVNEVGTVLARQAAHRTTREAAWQYLQDHFDAIIDRIPARRAGQIVGFAARFCDAVHREQAARFFEPRVSELPGGPRNLAAALESIDLCAARVAAAHDQQRREAATTEPEPPGAR